jgi:hypothetical protein
MKNPNIRESNAMTSESYKRFAASSLNSTEGVTCVSDKVRLLIMAEAWLDLAEQTTQIVDHESDEAHGMIEQPLRRARVHGH